MKRSRSSDSIPGRILRCPRIGLAFAGLVLLVTLAPSVGAERRPRDPEELVATADVIVVGRIVDLQLTTARSETETSIGNYDLFVDVTLAPTRIEKGELPQDVLVVARGFKSKWRLSVVGQIGLGGHRPIPAVGTEVRAHLIKHQGRWSIIYPNGLTPVDGVTKLTDAREITAQRRRLFTLWLPIELWIVFLVAGLMVVALLRLLKRVRAWRQARSRSSREADN